MAESSTIKQIISLILETKGLSKMKGATERTAAMAAAVEELTEGQLKYNKALNGFQGEAGKTVSDQKAYEQVVRSLNKEQTQSARVTTDNAMAIRQLGFMVNDSAQFSLGLQAGLRGITNNLGMLAIGAGLGSAAILGIEVAATTLLLLAPKISDWWREFDIGANKVRNAAGALEELVEVVGEAGPFLIGRGSLLDVDKMGEDALKQITERRLELIRLEKQSSNTLADRALIQDQETMLLEEQAVIKAFLKGIEEEVEDLEDERLSKQTFLTTELGKQVLALSAQVRIGREMHDVFMDLDEKVSDPFEYLDDSNADLTLAIQLAKDLRDERARAAKEAEQALKRHREINADLVLQAQELNAKARSSVEAEKELIEILKARVKLARLGSTMPAGLPPELASRGTRGDGPAGGSLADLRGRLQAQRELVDTEMGALRDVAAARARELEVEISALETRLAGFNVGKAIGDGMADATVSLMIGTEQFTAVLGQFAIRLGQSMIQFGLAGKAIQKFITNPTTAIVAGAALVALGAALKRRAQAQVRGLQGGVGGSSGGGGIAGPQRIDRASFSGRSAVAGGFAPLTGGFATAAAPTQRIEIVPKGWDGRTFHIGMQDVERQQRSRGIKTAFAG